MKIYQISFQRENGTTCTDRVVASNPTEAKKLFKEIYRHGEGFQDKELKVELVAENVPATKDQEREALAKIKAIVESLGPDSYVGTAFEGCFEIAEDNIGNDFACSMKQRVDAVVLENMNLKEKLKDLQEKLEKSQEAYNLALECGQALNEKVLSDDDLTDCISLVNEKIYEYEESVNKASKAIVELAEDPTSQDFIQAVNDHRTDKKAKEYFEALRTRLQKAAHQ